MIIKIKRAKGGSWLGIFPNKTSEPIAVWAGTAKRVMESEVWQELGKQYDITFDVKDEVWEDTTHLLPSEDEIARWGKSR